MMNEQIITSAPEGATHLGDWMTEIPANCILNKGITGCGATTLAIRQAGHTIIAMPFVGLIQNKENQHSEVLGIYGSGDKTEKIKEYVQNNEILKIAVTYDSLPKLCNILTDLGLNPFKEYHLVIDEWHILFNAYCYRNEAIKGLLDIAGQFDKVTYISATPIERKYWLKELAEYPEYIIEWPNATRINVRSHKIDKPLIMMANLCRRRMKNDSSINFHIFLNSVEGIAKIIKVAGLKPEDVRIICSNGKESARRNQSKLLEDFFVGNTSEPVKTFNFYTSTCFEGQDIYDENGRTFIVSEPYKKHTMVDISTSFIQICGRIRDSIYKGEIIHFYATSHYNNCPTVVEFENMVEQKIVDAEELAKDINGMSDKSRKKVIKGVLLNEPYITVKNDIVEVDRNMASFEVVNYKIVNGIYKSQINMISELGKNGLNVTDDTSYMINASIDMMARDKISFKDLFEAYCQLKENEPQYTLNRNFQIEDIENRNPLIKKAYEILGTDEVRRMKYHQSNIKRQLIAKSHNKVACKIVLLVDKAIPMYEYKTLKYIKETLQSIYDELGLTKKAKATDLDEWFETKQITRCIDGKNVSCKMIISKKLIAVNSI